MFFFLQAEDGIRDIGVTGVQTCALPISPGEHPRLHAGCTARAPLSRGCSPGAARIIVGAPGVPDRLGVISNGEASRYSPPCNLIVTASVGCSCFSLAVARSASCNAAARASGVAPLTSRSLGCASACPPCAAAAIRIRAPASQRAAEPERAAPLFPMTHHCRRSGSQSNAAELLCLQLPVPFHLTVGHLC